MYAVFRTITDPIMNNKTVSRSYHTFLESQGKSDHERLCQILNSLVVPKLHRLLDVNGFSSEYYVEFSDNKGRRYHIIPVRPGSAEYYDADLGNEYNDWRIQSRLPFGGRIFDMFTISVRGSEPLRGQDVVQPFLTNTYSVTSSTNDLAFDFIDEAGYYYSFSGLTGYNPSYNSIYLFNVYNSDDYVVTESVGSTSQTNTKPEGTGRAYATYTGSPPIVNLSSTGTLNVSMTASETSAYTTSTIVDANFDVSAFTGTPPTTTISPTIALTFNAVSESGSLISS
jgi:hypothetical protein